MKNNHKIHNRKATVCNHCGYEKNPTTAVKCVKCGESLNVSVVQNGNQFVKTKPLSIDDWLSNPWTIRLSIGVMFLFFSWLIYCLFVIVNNVNNTNNSRIYTYSGSTENTNDEIKLYNSMKDVPNVPNGIFNYGPSSTLSALTAEGLHEAMTKAHPNFRFSYTDPKDNLPGGKKGITMLLNGQVSFTLYGASLEDVHYKKAKQRGFGLKQVPVGIDILVVFTHKDIPIPGLSLNQLQDIYKGKLTNWKQVGGPDLAIVPFARDPKAANLLRELLAEEIDQLSSKVRFADNYTDAIRKVASTPGGISFGGNALVGDQQTIRSLPIAKANSQEYVQPFINNSTQINISAIQDGSYPLIRRRFVVFRLDGTIDQLAAEAYVNMLMSKEGQAIVKKAGLVPVR